MTQTAKAFLKACGRHGHFWERRDRACQVEDDPYALAALCYIDRNPVRQTARGQDHALFRLHRAPHHQELSADN